MCHSKRSSKFGEQSPHGLNGGAHNFQSEIMPFHQNVKQERLFLFISSIVLPARDDRSRGMGHEGGGSAQQRVTRFSVKE